MYFNLSMAYTFLNSFAKAREYWNGRKEFGSNWFSGLKQLKLVIDFWEKRYNQTKNFPILLNDERTYVYKDPETKRRELAEQEALRLAAEQATKDSLNATKKKNTKTKTAMKPATKPKTNVKKPKA